MAALLPETLCEATLEFVRYVDQRVETFELRSAGRDTESLDALFLGAVDDIYKHLAPSGQSASLSRMPAWVAQRFRYFLAAWADEYMIRALGEKLPTRAIGAIEARTFGTREAGERVFALIDDLLAEQGEAADALLPSVNWIFALGFAGQYRDENQASDLRVYRDRVAAYAFAVRSPQSSEPTALKASLGRAPSAPLLLLVTAACWLIAMCISSLYFWQTVKWNETAALVVPVAADAPMQTASSGASAELTPRTLPESGDRELTDPHVSGENRLAAETQ
ncbi:DotU family type IV/VI secretion system protein [Caballeronia zhejiangensis]|uniref:DotU family type IV/VI secretion system protein n=1 Tax=Caballeronia zhejiangensis TaxID=871203 RepID=UPI00158CCC97|nr:DotU family type IV/VI secretion system protein [Caballeronia zhejiangensis]